MKKTISIIAIALLAMTSQAGSFNWGGGGTISVIDNGTVTLWNSYSDTATGTKPTDGYLALFYIGQTGSLSGIGDLVVGDAVATIPTVVLTSVKSNNQIAVQKYEFTTEYIANATFQIFWVNEAGALENIFSTSQVALNTQLTVADVGGTATISPLYASGGGTTAYAVNATPVPEPATAALAIAGLAMLIRRRRK